MDMLFVFTITRKFNKNPLTNNLKIIISSTIFLPITLVPSPYHSRTKFEYN